MGEWEDMRMRATSRRPTVASEPRCPCVVHDCVGRVAAVTKALNAVTAERDRLWKALVAIRQDVQVVQRLDMQEAVNWLERLDAGIRRVLSEVTPPPGRTRPKDCSICRREDCTREHACE